MLKFICGFGFGLIIGATLMTCSNAEAQTPACVDAFGQVTPCQRNPTPYPSYASPSTGQRQMEDRCRRDPPKDKYWQDICKDFRRGVKPW